MIDIIPKESRLSIPISPSSAKIFSFGILGTVLVLSAGLWFVERNVQEEIRRTEEAILGVKTEDIRRLERDILADERKLRDGKRIMETRQSPEGVLQFLEQNAHPEVTLSSFLWSRNADKIVLIGTVPNFRALEEQVRMFRQEGGLPDADISHVEVGGRKGITFEVEAMPKRDLTEAVIRAREPEPLPQETQEEEVQQEEEESS